MMDPAIWVAVIACIGAITTAVVSARKDREQVKAAAHAQDTDAAIASLKSAFEIQRTMTNDCLGKCAHLETENGSLRDEVNNLKEVLRHHGIDT